jgi:hypothetical protein
MANPCSPYDSSKLAILGVIHRDKEGSPLLTRWLDAWRPEVITLEFSSFGLHFRQNNGKALKTRARAIADDMRAEGRQVDEGALSSVLAYMDPSFEFSVAAAFAERRNLPLFLVDDDRFSRRKLADMEELMSRENLEKLLSSPIHYDHRREKALARLFFEQGLDTLPYTAEMEVRDRGMRDRIQALMACHGGARFLHICGWEHLRDPLNLYDPLNPTKVFIYDKALCV